MNILSCKYTKNAVQIFYTAIFLILSKDNYFSNSANFASSSSPLKPLATITPCWS